MRRTLHLPNRPIYRVLLTSLVAVCALLFLSGSSARAGNLSLSFSLGSPVVQGYYGPTYGYVYSGIVMTTMYPGGHHYRYYDRRPHYYGKHRTHYRWYYHSDRGNRYRDGLRHHDWGGGHQRFDRHDRGQGPGTRGRFDGRNHR